MAVFCVWDDAEALGVLRSAALPGILWQEETAGADAIFVQQGQKAPPTTVRAAAVPENTLVPARQLVSYGVGPRSTLTLSSVRGDALLCYLQREIVNLSGERLERQEFRLPSHAKPEKTLGYAAALLLAGLEPSALAGFLEGARQ